MDNMHPNAKDLTNQRFDRLIALKPTDERRNRSIVWYCICDCGNECFVSSINLQSNNTKSCGCLNIDKIIERNFKHGMSDTSIHNIWKNMLQRCENPSADNYKYYKGRGIKVSKEFHDFQIWYDHIGPQPGPRYSQDRINNNGNYERGNIRWATLKEQRANSRPSSCGPSKQYWFRAWHKNSMAQWMSNNQTKFAEQHGLDRWTVGTCIRGKQKQHKGWRFKKI